MTKPEPLTEVGKSLIESEPLSSVLLIRVTPTQKKQIANKAWRTRRSISEYIRDLAALDLTKVAVVDAETLGGEDTNV